MSSSHHTNIRLIIGLIIIAMGFIFLLENLDIFYFDLPFHILSWPIILITIGLILLASARNKGAGIILIVIGLIGLFPEFWPLILVILGLYIILRKGGSKFHKTELSTDNYSFEEFNEVAIFGGGKKFYKTEKFRGGKITAIFGGSELHLLDCSLDEGTHELDLFIMFGGTTILIPGDWNVEIDLLPIFGGFSDNRRKDPNLISTPNRTLRIKGLILFGGGEIKN